VVVPDDGRPVHAAPFVRWHMFLMGGTVPSDFVAFPDDDGSSPRHPNAACDQCGRMGTAVRVTRHHTPVVVNRYCSSCWREVRADVCLPSPASRSAATVMALLARPKGPPVTVVSRSWDDTIDFIERLTYRSGGVRALSPRELDAYRATVAAEIKARAWDMDGPMPREVQAFVERHHRPAA
jgi:hypothetical protein